MYRIISLPITMSNIIAYIDYITRCNRMKPKMRSGDKYSDIATSTRCAELRFYSGDEYSWKIGTVYFTEVSKMKLIWRGTPELFVPFFFRFSSVNNTIVIKRIYSWVTFYFYFYIRDNYNYSVVTILILIFCIFRTLFPFFLISSTNYVERGKNYCYNGRLFSFSIMRRPACKSNIINNHNPDWHQYNADL